MLYVAHLRGISMKLETVTFTSGDFREITYKPSLDIPHLVTDKVLMPKDESPYMLFLAHLDKSYRPRDGCPFCHSDDLKLDGLAHKPRLVHDVSRNNMRVDILIQPPRMTCNTCKAEKFTPEIDGITGSRQMTNRLEEYLRKEVFLQPFNVLCERSGFSNYTISKIMDEEMEKYEAKRKANPPKAPRVLGIDEKHLRKEARGVLVDIESGKLLDMLVDNKKDTMIAGIKGLKDWDKNIEVVTVDMNAGYISWLPELLPNATIVVDVFHVVKNVEKTITKSRKKLIEYRQRLIEEIPDEMERARQSEILMIVRKHPKLFNYSTARLARDGKDERKKQLATVIDAFPEFKMLHNLRYYVEFLYEQTNREDAQKVWDEWYTFMPPGGPKQYQEWCDTYMFDKECFDAWQSFSRFGFKRFEPYILNYFNSPETRFTNAATEGLNSLVTDVNMQGKGYSFQHLRAKCLYASLVHKRKVYRIKLNTFNKWKREDMRMSFMMHFNIPESIILYEDVEECSIPELNIYRSNGWLANSMNDEFIWEQEHIRYTVASMDLTNEMPQDPKTPAIYILEMDPPEERLSLQ